MKSLKPTMREKKRYLIVKGHVEDIEKAILDFIGVLGMSKIGLNFIKKDRDSAIIAINRESINEVRSSLCVWSEKINIEKVSGTLKGLRNKTK